MKLRPRFWAVTWRYLVVSFIILLVVATSFFAIFLKIDPDTGVVQFTGWGVAQYLFVIGVPVILVIFYILSVTLYYYKIDEYSFSMVRFGKEFVFDYVNIEFIDIDESRRKNQVIFYSPKSKTRYLLGDKDGILLETLIKKCPKTISVAEFKRKHPEERY